MRQVKRLARLIVHLATTCAHRIGCNALDAPICASHNALFARRGVCFSFFLKKIFLYHDSRIKIHFTYSLLPNTCELSYSDTFKHTQTHIYKYIHAYFDRSSQGSLKGFTIAPFESCYSINPSHTIYFFRVLECISLIYLLKLLRFYLMM